MVGIRNAALSQKLMQDEKLTLKKGCQGGKIVSAGKAASQNVDCGWWRDFVRQKQEEKTSKKQK